MGFARAQPILRAIAERLRQAGVRRAARRIYSALAPENFTTLPHFSVSAATNAANSAAVSANGVVPASASRALTVGSLSPALISRLSVVTISGGVPLGTPTPNQALAS